MSNPLVSISCITYNQESYVEETIKSLIMQKTNFQYEILIHDDASTDKTVEIIKKYEKKFPEIIKPIYQTENQHSKGNKLIMKKFNLPRAKGKYIAICEGDDYWTDPYKLQKQVDYLEKNESCAFCFHATKKVDTNGKMVGEVKPYDRNKIAKTEDIILGGGGYIGTNSIVFRKSLLENAPVFYTSAPVGDYPLQIFLSTQKYGYYYNEFMSAYRVNVPGSWTNRTNQQIEKLITHNDNSILMLEEFNRYFNYQYNDAVNKRIINLNFSNLILQGKLRELKKMYRIKYSSLSSKEKLVLHIKVLFPQTFYRSKMLIKKTIGLFKIKVQPFKTLKK